LIGPAAFRRVGPLLYQPPVTSHQPLTSDLWPLASDLRPL